MAMGMGTGGDEVLSLGFSTSSSSWPASSSNAYDSSISASTPIDASNIGFQLLKKHGWKEGTGLGVFEQGRLEPVQAFMKKNKRGLGADKVKKIKEHFKKSKDATIDEETDKSTTSKKNKGISKRLKKMQAFEKQLQEKEFERAFFREFWPDNV